MALHPAELAKEESIDDYIGRWTGMAVIGIVKGLYFKIGVLLYRPQSQLLDERREEQATEHFVIRDQQRHLSLAGRKNAVLIIKSEMSAT